jgi:hypothetical protein
MHIIDVGMQYYTYIARFTTITLRTFVHVKMAGTRTPTCPYTGMV